ncbi:hypothetical protein UlMin_012180 [Ulmus minor]
MVYINASLLSRTLEQNLEQRKMKKPSSSILLFSKIIFYFQILLPHVKFQSAAQDLDPNEVKALNTIIDKLKPKESVPVSESFCQNTGSNYGFSIICDCTYDDNKKCHITGLMFNNLDLSGIIDEAMGELPKLRKIVLSDNKIQGNIPSSLGTLDFLENLDLSNNRLTGPIPDTLGSLWSLKWLFLQRNSLDGSIPSSLGHLTDLIILNLDFNKLTGSIPDELGNLANLEYMHIAENKLTGDIPPKLGNLGNLKQFWLPSNLLTGHLPGTFSELRSMTWFGVAGNKLSGPLPTYVLKNWPRVKSLIFLGNHFEGHVPTEYFQLPNLEFLSISDLNTSKTFQLPRSAKMDSIYRLVLRNCLIDGLIPKYISEVSSLKYLDLSFNKLTGEMPDGMKSNLIYMSFARNNLTGKIPEWIFQASRVRMDLSYNNFSELDAPVPSELDLNLFACCCCKSTLATRPYMLQPVQMMETYFHKQKPKFYNLFINCGGEQTTADGNHYDAENETSRFHVSSLMNWAFSSSGDFFVEPENTSDYTKRLSCKISNSEASLYEEARLSPLSLNYYGLSLYEGLYNVTLHFAEIVYTEDESDYNNLRRRVFDVYIQDELVLKDFNIKDQAGGPNEPINRTFPTHVNELRPLLNIHLYWTGKGSYSNPPSYNGPLISAISVKPTFKVDDEKLPPWAVALICVGSLVFVLLLFLALAWRLGWLEDKEFGEEIKMAGTFDPKLTVKELIKATGNFSKMIGTGGLGEVYEANLQNQKLAVKKISSHFKKNIIDMKDEILKLQALSPLENLMPLLGVHIGEKLQLIVYQFMENKSLENFLFGSEFSLLNLKWETRLNICKGIVRGLKELHDTHKKLHGNIKLTNILLDESYTVKLSDYGMTGAYTEKGIISIIQKEAPKGNMAPEYYVNAYTRKSDVYSVGIMLLMIVSGRKSEAVKAENGSVAVLLYDAKSLKKIENLTALVDKNLQPDKFNKEQARDILELALKCTERLPRVRPEISEVLDKLLKLAPDTSTEGGTADSGDAAETTSTSSVPEK